MNQRDLPKQPIKKEAEKDTVIRKGVVFRKGTKLYKCPECNSFVEPNMNYCSECGQKFEWRSEK